MKKTKKTEAPAVNLARHAHLAGIELVINATIEKHVADAVLFAGLAPDTAGYDNAAYFAAKAAEEYHKAAAVAALRINLLPLLNGGGK